ncbi:MAG TPA: deoxyhypusine synthase [bacterium]|nr:deoxyhypusine synthase [bacterium]
MASKSDYLKQPIQHIDIKKHDLSKYVDALQGLAFQARNLNRGAKIFDQMVADPDCGIILCLAGSIVSAGLKQVVIDLIENRMVDAIVSTGANIVDQDFFEGLGFKHYIGSPAVDDNVMRELHIDRIYDTFIDEDELRVCDEVTGKIADELEARPYSSREFILEMGRYLDRQGKKIPSLVHSAFQHDVPIFCPAFSDCSAGFGLVMHQTKNPDKHLTIDSARDFRELTNIKIASKDTGLFMIGGGVPKNFAQDIVVAADLLGQDAPMHKYAIQVTVADERDGGLSGSTLREASSWGKVDTALEQMIYAEATLAMPLIVSYAYHRGNWKNRKERRFARLFEKTGLPMGGSKTPVAAGR